MARVTVEDCTEVIPSRFELVALAAQRARLISSGAEVLVSRDNDKDAVVSLREIAKRKVDIEQLREILIHNNQEKIRLDEYGVEQISNADAEEAGIVESEAEDEIISLSQAGDDLPTEELLYGDDNVDVVD